MALAVAQQPRRAAQRRRNALTGAASVAVHAVAIALLVTATPHPPLEPEPEPMVVALVPPHPPEVPSPPTEKPPTPEPPPPPPPRHVARPARHPPPDAEPIPAGKGPTANGDAEVSEAELASASTAGSGGGRSCNMTQWLQSALRKDARVQAAVAEVQRGAEVQHGPTPVRGAIRVWNGDWIRHGEQEGNGLAAVREAIMWEVGFAPVACRNEPVRGLVAISLNDGPAPARLVMGQGEWRWADLLSLRSGRP